MKQAYMLIIVGLLVCTPIGAQVSSSTQGYQAHYQILPLNNTTQIGEYRISQFWQPESQNWLQHASISFSINTLLATYHYDYSDEVIYSGSKTLHYLLKENDNGSIRQISGSSNQAKQQLELTWRAEKGDKQVVINNADFDYTLFTLRFPSVCDRQKSDITHNARVVAPLTGTITPVQIRYLGHQAVTLLDNPLPRHDLCLIEIISNKQILSQSWMNAEGYLVYAIYPRYRLSLLSLTSNLLENTQGGSS